MDGGDLENASGAQLLPPEEAGHKCSQVVPEMELTFKKKESRVTPDATKTHSRAEPAELSAEISPLSAP